MTTSTVSARFVGFDLPTSTEDSVEKVRDRLVRSQQARAARRLAAPAITTTPDCLDALLDDLLDTSSSDTPSVGTSNRAMTWSRRYMRRRTANLERLNHLKPDDRAPLLAAACGAHAVGVVDRDQMEELIAELHAVYPWLASASTAIMKHMRLRTLAGPAPLHTPPLVLLGPPGIAKSSWARDLGRVGYGGGIGLRFAAAATILKSFNQSFIETVQRKYLLLLDVAGLLLFGLEATPMTQSRCEVVFR